MGRGSNGTGSGSSRRGLAAAGINASALANFDTVADLKAAFIEAVDDYIETCAKIGKTLQKPYSGQIMVRVDPQAHARAAFAAELSGKSLARRTLRSMTHRSMRVLGFMTGTSLDAVDMAVLETDGEAIQAFGPAGERKLSDRTRDLVLEATEAARAWPRGDPEPEVLRRAARAVTEEHLAAGESFLAEHGLAWSDLDLVGMHGQTVLHERPRPNRIGRTVQLGDGAWLARRISCPVAFDFRTADMAAGGEGAPLAPIYHLARLKASGHPSPAAVLNIGGVANITLVSTGDEVVAFDTGPGNGMIDLLVQARGAGRYDHDGRLAAAGRSDPEVLDRLLSHPYFAAPPPKSLDRHDFALDALKGLALEDAAATLAAFTAEAVARAFVHAADPPANLIVTGGGRHNPELMRALRGRAPVEVLSAEDAGWRGDSIEAEAFAYLAARTASGLPISFPGVTGVATTMTGGRISSP